jgi:hypothetical protein
MHADPMCMPFSVRGLGPHACRPYLARMSLLRMHALLLVALSSIEPNHIHAHDACALYIAPHLQVPLLARLGIKPISRLLPPAQGVVVSEQDPCLNVLECDVSMGGVKGGGGGRLPPSHPHSPPTT